MYVSTFCTFQDFDMSIYLMIRGTFNSKNKNKITVVFFLMDERVSV